MIGLLLNKVTWFVVALAVSAAGGAYAMKRWDAPAIIRLTADLREARASAIAQQRALTVVRDMCAANDAATSQAHDLNATLQRAIDDARQELDNATGDDADPLRAQFDRLRNQGPSAPGRP